MSLLWMSLCWISLCWISQCWMSRFNYCNAECHYAEFLMLNVIRLNVTCWMSLHWMSLGWMSYAECRYAECHMLNVIMLNVICWMTLCWMPLCRLSWHRWQNGKLTNCRGAKKMSCWAPINHRWGQSKGLEQGILTEVEGGSVQLTSLLQLVHISCFLNCTFIFYIIFFTNQAVLQGDLSYWAFPFSKSSLLGGTIITAAMTFNRTALAPKGVFFENLQSWLEQSGELE